MINQLWRNCRTNDGKEARVWLQMAPGFWLWRVDKPQTLGDVFVVNATFGNLTPVDLSETVRDLEMFM
jgi:hypothetical protein